jgi:hypothetical protein
MLSLLTLTALLLATIGSLELNAGGKTKDDETVLYTDLGRDQGIYAGIIIEENSETKVTKLSFAGQTSLDGIKKESDSSSNQISLSDIQSIQVIDPLFESKRHPEREYCLVKICTKNECIENLLMPRHLVICGQAVHSKIKKSWSLRTIKKIELSDD